MPRLYSILSFILSLSLLSLSACKQDRQAPVPQSQVPVSGNNGGNAGQGSGTGSGDGGGGTGLKNKMFEQYIKESHVILTENGSLQSLLEEFDQIQLYGTHLEEAFLYVLTSKNWYFVPEKVKAISGSQMSLGTENKFEQFAFQNQREVWIDQDKFEKMNKQERMALLVHEIVLDLYVKSKILNAFDNKQGHLIENILPSFCELSKGVLIDPKDEEEVCLNVPDADPARRKSMYSILAPEDYLQVRDLTSLILNTELRRDEIQFIAAITKLNLSTKILGRLQRYHAFRFGREAEPLPVKTALQGAVNYVNVLPEELSCQETVSYRITRRSKANDCHLYWDDKENTLSIIIGDGPQKLIKLPLIESPSEDGVSEVDIDKDVLSFLNPLNDDQHIQFTFGKHSPDYYSLEIVTNWTRTKSLILRDRAHGKVWRFDWILPAVQGYDFNQK